MRNPILWAVLFVGCALCSAVWYFVDLASASALQVSDLPHAQSQLFSVYSIIALSMLIYTVLFPPKPTMGLYGINRRGY